MALENQFSVVSAGLDSVNGTTVLFSGQPECCRRSQCWCFLWVSIQWSTARVINHFAVIGSKIYVPNLGPRVDRVTFIVSGYKPTPAKALLRSEPNYFSCVSLKFCRKNLLKRKLYIIINSNVIPRHFLVKDLFFEINNKVRFGLNFQLQTSLCRKSKNKIHPTTTSAHS